MPTRVLLLTCLAALAVGGCGGDDKTPTSTAAATTATTPAPPPDPRPRVEGKWRVVYRPANYEGETARVRWKAKPKCADGPCSFNARSSDRGTWFKFKFDDVVGDYTATLKGFIECVTGDGTVSAKRGYRYRRQMTLQVTASVPAPGGRKLATRMKGRNFSTYKTTRKGSLASCSDESAQSDRMVLVRVAPAPSAGGAPATTGGAAATASGTP